jgi:CsiD.
MEQMSQGRIKHYEFSPQQVSKFLQRGASTTVNDLHFVPYKRYLLAGYLLDELGEDVVADFTSCLQDYATGCALLDFGAALSKEDSIKVATAVSHLVAEPAIQGPGGSYYGITRIVDDDNPTFKLLYPYADFSLHSDGVFADNPVDWLMMMKLRECNVVGGRSRLLHMADWDDYEHFHNDPDNQVVRHGLLEKDGRYDVFRRFSSLEPSLSPILYKQAGRRQVKFVDQYVIPNTIAQARFIASFQAALETSRQVTEIALAPGSMIILNNHFWMHGRSAFERHPHLEREQLRQYGVFSR